MTTHISKAIVGISLIALAVTLSACSTTTKRKRMPVTPQQMICNDGVHASITLYSPEEARLVYNEKSYRVQRENAAVGIKYGNGDISFSNKGISATIVMKDGTTSTCEYLPKAGL
jgi:membrane-bound inhibitor of C-type lysozyme